MKSVIRSAVVAVAAGALSGCGDKPAEAPKQYAPPPKMGTDGALRGNQGPAGATVPK